MSDTSSCPIEVDVSTVNRMLQQEDEFVLLDCREHHEYEAASITGSVLLPMSELRERWDELASHRDRHIVVHCHHGVRSLQVAQALRSQGFATVQSMAGGIDRWSLDVDSTVPRY